VTGHDSRTLRVEVAYALPDAQALIPLEVEDGTTAGQAIELSGILLRFPDLVVARGRVGIFGKSVDPDTVLREGDRVEIYRPLVADPKEARRRRVGSAKQKRRG
jgi:uncharacterized protein